MPATIEAKGLQEAAKFFKGLPKQIDFATSQAINDTARDVQRFTIDDILPNRLTLRSKGSPWWRPGSRFGFNIRFASKTRLEATVGSQADWLRLQEEGGVKTGSGGHRIAIPTPFWKRREEILTRGRRPRALLRLAERAEKKRFALLRQRDKETAAGQYTDARGTVRRSSTRRRDFLRGLANIDKGKASALRSATKTPFTATVNGKPGIFVRSGPRLPIHRLFTFEQSTDVPRRLSFVQAAREKANDVYPAHFRRRLTDALATAKP